MEYIHEKGENGGSFSFKFNLQDPEGNKLIDQSFFISVLGRCRLHPPQPVRGASVTHTGMGGEGGVRSAIDLLSTQKCGAMILFYRNPFV